MYPRGLREWPNGVSSFCGGESSLLGTQARLWERKGACFVQRRGVGVGSGVPGLQVLLKPGWMPAAAASGLENICRKPRKNQKSKLRRRQHACMHGLCKHDSLN